MVKWKTESKWDGESVNLTLRDPVLSCRLQIHTWHTLPVP